MRYDYNEHGKVEILKLPKMADVMKEAKEDKSGIFSGLKKLIGLGGRKDQEFTPIKRIFVD